MSSKLAQFLHRDRYQAATLMLDVPEVRKSVDELLFLLFPERSCHKTSELKDIEATLLKLKIQFASYFEAVSTLEPTLKGNSLAKADAFFDTLPEVTNSLDLDVQAAFAGDPAAYSREEVILTYPGFYAVCIHRLAHVLHQLKIPLIPRLMSEYAHEKTGIDIHPGATIGASFFIDHGTGVVVGETSIIGKNVKIYQGVTLGALSVRKRMQSTKRHPTIEDDVVIYANATILGGDTIVGKSSIIGGNVWIIESVPQNSVITVIGQ
ncbi:MAG TPA: serine O-acetyltransferase EpsC [Bacteriovoracaceae bacterium]|nr:serine O-acetyltransferase EpsC [Bacteriovoracaceae bacterium]